MMSYQEIIERDLILSQSCNRDLVLRLINNFTNYVTLLNRAQPDYDQVCLLTIRAEIICCLLISWLLWIHSRHQKYWSKNLAFMAVQKSQAHFWLVSYITPHLYLASVAKVREKGFMSKCLGIGFSFNNVWACGRSLRLF